MSLTIKKAKRINDLPPYLFAEIDRRKREALGRGVDLIDLRIGDPDIPTQDRIVQEALRAILDPIYETDFQPYSFGFRKGRCTMECHRSHYVIDLTNTKVLLRD